MEALTMREYVEKYAMEEKYVREFVRYALEDQNLIDLILEMDRLSREAVTYEEEEIGVEALNDRLRAYLRENPSVGKSIEGLRAGAALVRKIVLGEISGLESQEAKRILSDEVFVKNNEELS